VLSPIATSRIALPFGKDGGSSLKSDQVYTVQLLA
jgi:hypothetical protein